MLEKLKEVLVETLNVEAEEVTPEASLSDDLGIDSLSSVELSLELESAFDITISDDELLNLTTVQDILDLVASKTN